MSPLLSAECSHHNASQKMSGNEQTPQPPLVEAAFQQLAFRCCTCEPDSGRAMPLSQNELVVSNRSHLGQGATGQEPALQSINMNSTLDRHSPPIGVLSPAKIAAEPFNLSGISEKENCPSPPFPEAEKSMAPSIDRQDDSLAEYSTSFTTVSQSPRRKDTEGFTIWNNAMFRLEAWEFTSWNGEDKSLDPSESAVSAGFNRLSLSTSASAVAGSSPPVLSEQSIKEDDQQISYGSSAGSTSCVPDQSIKYPQAPLWKRVPAKDPVLNFVKFGREIHDTAAALKDKKPPTKSDREVCRQNHKLAGTKPVVRRAHKDIEYPSPSFGVELGKPIIFMADDEAKIRAELEREIEKDLEQEIKRKILLLNQRLEELHALQAQRYCKQGQKNSRHQKASTLDEGLVKSISPLDDITNPQMNFPESFETWKKVRALGAHEHNKTSQEQKKSTVQGSPIQREAASCSLMKKGVHFSYASSPVTYWRKQATVTTLSPSRLDWNSQTNNQPCDISHSVMNAFNGNKSTRKGSGERLAKSSRNDKPKAEAQKANLQPFHSWTSVASTKKFDWVRTLRSGVSSSPRLSSKGLHYGLKLSAKRFGDLLSIRETFSGEVVRNLFPDDTPSTSSKDVLPPHKVKHNSHIPFASLKYDQHAVSNGYHHYFRTAKVCSQEQDQGAAAAEKICRKHGTDHMATRGRQIRTVSSEAKCIKISTKGRHCSHDNQMQLQNSNERENGCISKSPDHLETLIRMGNPQEQILKAVEHEFGNLCGDSKSKEKRTRDEIKSSSNDYNKERRTKIGSPMCRTTCAVQSRYLNKKVAPSKPT